MDLTQAASDFLRSSGWLERVDHVEFLAAGEYNANYLVRSQGQRWVLRVNHGSQLGLDNQIGYEFRVLSAVAGSGVTPVPRFVDPDPAGLPGGCLLMEYLPGEPLDYSRDLERAGKVFARIHALDPSPDMLVQAEPVADIARECLGLIHRYPDHPLTGVRDRLLDYHERVMDLHRRTRELFAAEAMVMVNTEVNSHNFIVDRQNRAGADGARLVDWEKAVVSPRYQDLGHFTVATTTRWKADVVLSAHDKSRFLSAYARELERLGAPVPAMEDLEAATGVLERAILLRALSWCYMAWYEYTQTDRPIRNPDTFAKIGAYLDESECLLH